MKSTDSASKGNAGHLARTAVVYRRQSSIAQLGTHAESPRLQYALKDTAKACGFTEVEVIDADVGMSAASGACSRVGFKRLLASVALGEVGMVLSREPSRPSRIVEDPDLRVQQAIARLQDGQGDGSDKRAALERQLQQARYEAGRAFAPYDHAEPGNRLMCEVLGQRWNAKLEEQQRIAKALDALEDAAAALTPAEELTLRELGRRTHHIAAPDATDPEILDLAQAQRRTGVSDTPLMRSIRADLHVRDDIIHPVRRGLRHPTRTACGAEPAPLAAERQQLFAPARAEPKPREAVRHQAPEVVPSKGLRTCTTPQSLRVSPARECMPARRPVRVIGLRLRRNAGKPTIVPAPSPAGVSCRPRPRTHAAGHFRAYERLRSRHFGGRSQTTAVIGQRTLEWIRSPERSLTAWWRWCDVRCRLQARSSIS
jgi:Resolvase, N terminal domain